MLVHLQSLLAVSVRKIRGHDPVDLVTLEGNGVLSTTASSSHDIGSICVASHHLKTYPKTASYRLGCKFFRYKNIYLKSRHKRPRRWEVKLGALTWFLPIEYVIKCSSQRTYCQLMINSSLLFEKDRLPCVLLFRRGKRSPVVCWYFW